MAGMSNLTGPHSGRGRGRKDKKNTKSGCSQQSRAQQSPQSQASTLTTTADTRSPQSSVSTLTTSAQVAGLHQPTTPTTADLTSGQTQRTDSASTHEKEDDRTPPQLRKTKTKNVRKVHMSSAPPADPNTMNILNNPKQNHQARARPAAANS